ncbi:MAG: exo-beta-N-acetylmuramidase NamZ family protein [Flavobacteriales bacterium]
MVFLHCSSANESLQVGAERTAKYFPLLKYKAIGVVGNQSSLIGTTHLVDSLLSAKLQVVKVFSPEHGFRGTADAGAHIESGIDEQTGLPIISLYGSNKKPSSSQLEGIEILVFDIQDVGARFYTYISTLHYVMEAAAENNIPLIVLDRPNPNGHYIDGPILDTAYRSFVGMHPIPIVHGMTIGEYAQMINGEKWLKDSVECDLTIIPMLGYNKHMPYDLPVKPSPNLPNAQAVNLYPSLCLFEGTNVSVGRGTDLPFQHYGAPFLESDYSFVPESGAGAKYPKHEGERCYGQDLSQFASLSQLDLSFLIDAYKACPEKEDFFNTFFDKLAGGDKLKLSIIDGKSEEEIRQSWSEELLEFELMRNNYLIYQ